MCAHHTAEPRTSGVSPVHWIAWLGGSDRFELLQPHEQSAHAVSGVVVLVNAVLGWVATFAAILPTTHRSVAVAALFASIFALLILMTARVVATRPVRGTVRRGATSAVVVALILGGVVGEFATLALLSGSVDRIVQEKATRSAASSPAVLKVTSDLQQARQARVALDNAVDTARAQRDAALEVARCEYHPTAACPQTRITGVPGTGPETRTDNDFLAHAQRELDRSVAVRDSRAPELDSRIADAERILTQTREAATTEAVPGLGARWLAMQELTTANTGTLILRLLTDGLFMLLGVLPAILRRRNGDTTGDLHAQARAERERAELLADTAIAVKRAEVRAEVENAWAERQLEHARLAVAAQTEIDRAQLRQQVHAAIEVTALTAEPVDDDVYLPIAAEAHAASLAAAATPAPPPGPDPQANLPATLERHDRSAIPAIPTIPDVTRAAARWIRPVVPGFVARAIDTSTHPFRTARQVIEEVEHITFSLTRTRKLTVETQETTGTSSGHTAAADHWRDVSDNHALADSSAQGRPLSAGSSQPRRGVGQREDSAALRAADGPRQLPPGD
ncbi:DUF4407 domain-containing protein [Mycobacterium paraterrae]|uniref:DUF4407 domain-containing protein n=1 Tax=Mycobacterium paraterrae TaxID=577492 RepID=UPI003D9CA045